MPTGIYKHEGHSEETKRKLSESHKGKKHSKETREKLSQYMKSVPLRLKPRLDQVPWNKGKKGLQVGHNKGKTGFSTGRKISESQKEAIRKANLGKKMSDETKDKISKAKIGQKPWNWGTGSPRSSYPPEFNKKLKLKIRTRDNFTCCLCRRTEREELEELNRVLSINHIDFNKKNCIEKNLNTLCLRCNVKINRERDYWTEYFNSNV